MQYEPTFDSGEVVKSVASVAGKSSKDAVNLTALEDMSRHELIDMLRAFSEGGIRVWFEGKIIARNLARRVRPRITRTVTKYCVGTAEEQAQNLIVEGDNLQSMVTLYKEHGQVDLIVTDPPYNTGKDFRYSDRWEDDPNDTDIGELVSLDDHARHTKWMRFMWPRIQIMHKMLKPGGVLAVCIDHRELFRLGQLLDERFGESNRLAIINWQKSYSPRNDNTHVSTATEYVLVYSKNADKATTSLFDRTEQMNARYKNPDNDPEGLWRPDNPCAGEGATHPGMVYGIQNPFTGKMQYPPTGKCWRKERAKMKKWLELWGGPYESRDIGDNMPSHALVLRGVSIPPDPNDLMLLPAREHAENIRDTQVWPELYFGDGGFGRPNIKRYLNKVKKGAVPTTYWAEDDYEIPETLESTSWEHEASGHSQTGINELDAILGKGHGFETVKPLRLIEKIIQLWCPPDGLVMDPFAGSGTTGHAVLNLNKRSGSKRRFIVIEQGRPEKGDSYTRTLTYERLRRVISGDWANGKGTPLVGGFRFVILHKKVDAKALLQMERSEMVDTVIASHFDANRRKGPGLIYMANDNYRYLVARNGDDEGFFLVWDGPSLNTDFTEDVYEACSEEAQRAGLKRVYHVYARLYLYQTNNVRFYQIPDRILADFGLDIRSDRYEEDE